MTNVPTTNLSNAEWKELSQSVTDEFMQLFAGADTFLGKGGLRFLETSLKSVSVKSEKCVGNLTALLALADLAGRGDVLMTGAKILLAVPFTGNVTVYEPIRQVMCGATRRARIDGVSDEPFASAIKLPNLELWPEKLELRDRLLVERANGHLLNLPSEDMSIHEVSAPSYHIYNTSIAIHELWLMWVFGGGEDWPLARIDAELDAAAKIMRKVTAII
jgi:hypothetical protein